MKKFVKVLSLVLALIMALSVFASCGGKGKDKANDKDDIKTEEKKEETAVNITAEEYAAITPEELIEKCIKDKSNVTVEEFVALVGTMDFAEVDEDELWYEYENPTREAIDLLKDDESVVLPEDDACIADLLKSENRAARYYGVSLLGSWLGVLDKDIDAVKELLKNEEEPIVLCNAVESLSSYIDTDADVAEFVLRMAEHEHPCIREKVMLAIHAYPEVEGVLDAVTALMADENAEVKSVALEYCGDLGDESIIPLLSAVLADAEQADFHGAAAEGLAIMWHGYYPSYENSNEAAYKAALNYVQSATSPDWTAVRTFWFQDKAGFEDWKTRASFFNSADVIAAMAKIISTLDAEYLSVVGAIDVIISIGTKAELEANKAIVDALEDASYDSKKEEYAHAVASAQ